MTHTFLKEGAQELSDRHFGEVLIGHMKKKRAVGEPQFPIISQCSRARESYPTYHGQPCSPAHFVADVASPYHSKARSRPERSSIPLVYPLN